MANAKITDETKNEAVKRPVGRPKKIRTESDTVNEDKQVVSMSANSVDAEERVRMADLNYRWKEITSRYASKLPASVISGAYNSAYNATFRNNPWLQNQRVKSLGTLPGGVDEGEIKKAISNPMDSELKLRSTSTSLMYQVYLYNVILNLTREVPRYYSYAFPIDVGQQDLNSASFKDEAKLVDSAINALKPELTFKTLAKAIAVEGKVAVVNRVSYAKDKCYFWVPQRLQSDWFKITGFGSKQPFICSFNFALFLNPIYSVDYYPPFFRKIWEEMQECGVVSTNEKGVQTINPGIAYKRQHSVELLNETYIYWVQLDQSDVFCFGSDMSYAAAIPDTTGMFLDMGELEKYRWIQLNTLVKSTNAILTGEMEFVKDPKPGANSTMLNPDTAIGFENLFGERVSSNVLPFFAPFKNYELFDIPEQPSAQSIILSRLKDIIASSGLSGLVSTSDKPSVSQTKISSQLTAEKTRYLTLQFQNYMNTVLNEQFGLKREWRVKLWGSIFDNDELKRDKEMLLSGVKSLLPKVLSAEGISMLESQAICNYMDALGLQVKYIEATGEGNTINDNPVGRPTIDDGDVVNDSTAASKDLGENVSDTKEFSAANSSEGKHFTGGMLVLSASKSGEGTTDEGIKEIRMCPCCGENELEDGEYLCEDCFNQQVEERLEKLNPPTEKSPTGGEQQ